MRNWRGHHSRSGVDWNKLEDYEYVICTQVTTLVVVWIEISYRLTASYAFCVTTLVVVWIEISKDYYLTLDFIVTTLVVVWIEIKDYL